MEVAPKEIRPMYIPGNYNRYKKYSNTLVEQNLSY